MDNDNFIVTSLEMSTISDNGFTGLSIGPDYIVMDPQLDIPCPGDLQGTMPEPSFMISPPMWDTQLATPVAFPSKGSIEPLEVEDNSHAATAASSYVTQDPVTTRKSSQGFDHSSNQFRQSITSPNSSHIDKRTRRSTKLKPQQQQQLSPPEEAWNEEESGIKRTEYLERNRVAASKCRQKNKERVHDLAERKGALETKHTTLQREYNTLLNDKNEIGRLLMAHARCNDRNIDQWIELEAQKFVQRSASDADAMRRRMSETQSASVSDDQHQWTPFDQC